MLSGRHMKRSIKRVPAPQPRCLAIDGAGSPQAPVFEEAVVALFAVARALKLARKKGGEPDFVVGPLEGRWSADGDGHAAGRSPLERGRWRLRIEVPADVARTQVDAVKAAVTDKLRRKGEACVAVAGVFLETDPAGAATSPF